MARVDEPFNLPKRLTPIRLFIITVFLSGIVITGGYLVLTPLAQVYWGVYARVKPMRSEIDLARQGKPIPRKVAESDIIEEDDDPILLEESAAATTTTKDKPKDDILVDDVIVDEQPTVTKTEEKPAKTEEIPAATTTTADPAAKDRDFTKRGDDKYVLTKAMAEKAAGGPGGIVVLTWANYHYRDFVMNWVEHLQATGCKTFLVGAMDDDLLHYLLEKKIPVFAMRSGLSTGDFGWGSAQFHTMGREKIALIKAFTAMEVDVFISDVDTVWMRDPVSYAKKYPDADILTSSDGLTESVKDESIEIFERQMSAANIGIMLFRKRAAALAAEWMEVLDKDDKVWDQNAFNDLFRRGWKNSGRTDNLFFGYDGKLLVGILPVSIFCSGHTFFVQNMPKTLGLQPYVAHATFQYSGTEGKRNRFRETMLWNDPDEYFTQPNGFIDMSLNIDPELLERPKNFERDGKIETVERVHFALVNPQLTQMRGLFGLGVALKRAVVLPEIWCGMDRWWAGHAATIPGSEFKLPFICPADHVLNLEAMDKKDLGDDHFGEHIPWREYSFLKKEQAKPLLQSKLIVVTCKETDAGCADGSTAATVDNNTVKLKPQLTGEQLEVALKPIADKYKLIHFENPGLLWAGFKDETKANRFKNRLDMYAAIWCCVPDQHPGHVWYDFFWDILPHTDRHNREVKDKWKALFGP